MKRYRGDPLPSGHYVFVSQDEGKPYPLRHHVRHSPDGFSWGYGGSGPSELARCILLDYFGLDGDDGSGFEPSKMPVSYQDFKADVIAPLPQDEPFEITTADIDKWIAYKAEAG